MSYYAINGRSWGIKKQRLTLVEAESRQKRRNVTHFNNQQYLNLPEFITTTTTRMIRSTCVKGNQSSREFTYWNDDVIMQPKD